MTDAVVEGHCDPRFAEVRRRFEASFASGELGAAVCVRVAGERVVDLWGGHADAARQRPWRSDTLVNTASVTKAMTAACAHRLVDAGRLDLDAPVAECWPEFAAAGKATLPVHLLLSHRAGLPAIRESLPQAALFDWPRMCAALAAEAPYWEPGTQHGYHFNTFGWLVGEVVRRIDGRTLGTYFREEIAGPLGLDFHIGLPQHEHARRAEIVSPAEGTPRNKIYDGLRGGETLLSHAARNPRSARDIVNSTAWRCAEIPSGNGHGTARAVCDFYAALVGGGALGGVRVLSPEAVARARSEQASGKDAVLGFPTRFGLGFFLAGRFMPFGPNPDAFGHPGFGGALGFADPEGGVAFGYVMNQLQSGVAGDARGFALMGAVYECLAR